MPSTIFHEIVFNKNKDFEGWNCLISIVNEWANIYVLFEDGW